MFMLGLYHSMSVNFRKKQDYEGKKANKFTGIVVKRFEMHVTAGGKDGEAMLDSELTEMIEELCDSKAEEFKLIGYEHVTAEEIWSCVSAKYKKAGRPALHQMVNDILSLKVTQFMNYLTMSAYKGEFSFGDQKW
ncbi:post-transcriptional regulator [Paenibacillus yanchengensis]